MLFKFCVLKDRSFFVLSTDPLRTAYGLRQAWILRTKKGFHPRLTNVQSIISGKITFIHFCPHLYFTNLSKFYKIIYEDIKMTLQIQGKPWHYVYALSTKSVKEENTRREIWISAYGDMITRGIILINILYTSADDQSEFRGPGRTRRTPQKSAGLFNLDDKHLLRLIS